MKRPAFAPALTFVCVLVFSPSAFAQAKPGAQAPAMKAAPVTAAPAPAAPATFVKMVKGTADIQVIQSHAEKSRQRHGDGVENQEHVLGRDLAPEGRRVPGTTRTCSSSAATRSPIGSRSMPGEVIEITMKSPVKPDLYKNQFKFSHANGDVNAKAVKKFD